MGSNKIQSVPTNIITGFLGVGKTTFIQALLKNKPENERWAILVNEFGEIGIDEALFDKNNDSGVFIRQVPGGCMCCSSSLFMEVALNQLLAESKPHRLLIEPTGLGHPKEVLTSLSSAHYRDVLDIRATLTLVDARKVDVAKYREHPIYQEQITIADRIVVTKSDLYQGDELENLTSFLSNLGVEGTPISIADMDSIGLDLLADSSQFNNSNNPEAHDHTHEHHHNKSEKEANLKEITLGKVSNKGQGFFSYGWVYPSSKWFEFDKIMSVLSAIEVVRLKAVFITDKGIFGFNMVDDVLKCVEMDESHDSRLEFIVDDKAKADDLSEQLERAIFN